MKWNMTGVAQRAAEREEVRFDYYGTHTKSPIDGKDTIYFHHAKRRGLYFVSVLFMALAMIVCLGSVAALFYVRHLVREQSGEISSYDQWITPAMLSLQITIANRILYSLAAQLTHFENHRLDEDYDYCLTGLYFSFSLKLCGLFADLQRDKILLFSAHNCLAALFLLQSRCFSCSSSTHPLHSTISVSTYNYCVLYTAVGLFKIRLLLLHKKVSAFLSFLPVRT